MDDYEIVQTSDIKQKCPAFQEGCPYAKVEEKQLIATIEKCPEFKNGCPFKDAKSLAEVNEKLSHVPHSAGHESELSGQKLIEMFKKMHDTSEYLEEKLGDCPVFHKDQGCPFKNVRSEEGKHLVEPVDSVAHDQHIKEELQTIDATHLKDQCPAFKEGCPFSKLEDKDMKEAIEKCPEFKNGCPFKDAKSVAEVHEKLSHVPHSAGHESELSGQTLIEMFKKMHDTSESLEETLGDCPVFHKDQGCPFKSVRSEEGKHLVEPVESVAHDQHVKEELQTVDTTHLQEQCPAFKDGCPFLKLEDKDMKEAIEKCPEFQNGCPFKNAKSLAEVHERLSHVPHSAGHESELSGQKLAEMFKKMHDTSECLEEKLGNCPVFHKDQGIQGCPFKSVRSEEGKHLVEPVTSVLSPIRESLPPSPSKKKIMTTDVSKVQESCPAFQPSCPFAKIPDSSPGAFKNAMKCPKFKDGCAFEDCKSVSDIYLKLKEIPNLNEEQGSHGEVLGSLKMLHDMCLELEKQMGECPVFNTEMGCPFKTVCGDGKLMVAKMEENVTSRLISEGAHNVKEAMEDELLSSSGVVLHQELREKTKKRHKITDSMPFIRRMIKGKVSLPGYKLMLSNLYFIYNTMEEEGDKHKSHPKVKPVYFPAELRRTPEIIKDLVYHYGSDWKDEIKPLETTKRYLLRLRQLSEEDPMLLVAHQYTRYLGDLSGGRILKKIFMKIYESPNSEGFRFYEFDNITDIGDFKKLYRSRLDSLQLGREDADRMVNESLKSFDFHIELFAELAELCGIEPDPRREFTDVSSVPESDTSKPSPKSSYTKTSQESNSGGTLFVILALAIALFAILYSYLLA